MFPPDFANSSYEPSGNSQVDVRSNSIWFRTTAPPHPFQSMYLVEILFEQVNECLHFSLYWHTVNTCCLHVHIGCVRTLEIYGDLKQLNIYSQGMSRFTARVLDHKVGCWPFQCREISKPKGWIYFSNLGDPHCAPSWRPGPKCELVFLFGALKEYWYHCIPHRKWHRCTRHNSKFFCVFQLVMLHSQGKQADGRLEMEHTLLTECRKIICPQNSGESVLIIWDNMFECRCHTFCHMAQNKFCESGTFQYASYWIYFDVNAAFCFPLISDTYKSTQSHDKGQRAFFILSIIAVANNLCLPLLPSHCNFTERKHEKEQVHYGHYSFQLQRNWLKNRKPHIFKDNAISFG